MSNRWINALVKTLVFLLIVHIVLLLIGPYFGTGIGWFGLRMLWPHWETMGNSIISIILGIIIYFIVYAFFTKNEASEQ